MLQPIQNCQPIAGTRENTGQAPVLFSGEPIPDAPKDFYPARPNRLVQRIVQTLNIFFLKRKQLDVSISPKSIERLRALPASGVIIAPNHASPMDRFVMLEVVRRTGRTAQVMGSLTGFGYEHPLNRWIFQRMGLFSASGAPGDPGKTYAEKLLREGNSPLLIFPEGVESYQTQLLLPLRYGAASMALKAAKERPILIVPVGMKYEYAKDLQPFLEKALIDLEKKYGLSKQDGLSQQARLQKLLALPTTQQALAEAPEAPVLTPHATMDEMANQISRLQLYLLKQWPPSMQKALRKVEVIAGEPIDVRRYLSAAALDRPHAVQTLTADLQQAITRQLKTS